MTIMVQFSRSGKAIRRHRFNPALWAIWARQLPTAWIQLVLV